MDPRHHPRSTPRNVPSGQPGPRSLNGPQHWQHEGYNNGVYDSRLSAMHHQQFDQQANQARATMTTPLDYTNTVDMLNHLPWSPQYSQRPNVPIETRTAPGMIPNSNAFQTPAPALQDPFGGHGNSDDSSMNGIYRDERYQISTYPPMIFDGPAHQDHGSTFRISNANITSSGDNYYSNHPDELACGSDIHQNPTVTPPTMGGHNFELDMDNLLGDQGIGNHDPRYLHTNQSQYPIGSSSGQHQQINHPHDSPFTSLNEPDTNYNGGAKPSGNSGTPDACAGLNQRPLLPKERIPTRHQGVSTHATPSAYSTQPPEAGDFQAATEEQNAASPVNGKRKRPAYQSNEMVSAESPAESASSEQIVGWNPDISSAEEAEQWLLNPRVTHFKFGVEHDDFAEVGESIEKYAQGVFEVLLHEHTDIPEDLSDADIGEHQKTQVNRLKQCKNLMSGEEEVKDACAMSMMLISTAIKLHKNGIPIYKLAIPSAAIVLKERKEQEEVKNSRISKKQGQGKRMAQDRTIKTRTEFTINKELTCSERVKSMVDLIKKDKRVAHDVLKGHRDAFLNIACAPDRYLLRKQSNKTLNVKRGKKLKESKPDTGTALGTNALESNDVSTTSDMISEDVATGTPLCASDETTRVVSPRATRHPRKKA